MAGDILGVVLLMNLELLLDEMYPGYALIARRIRLLGCKMMTEMTKFFKSSDANSRTYLELVELIREIYLPYDQSIFAAIPEFLEKYGLET